MTHSAHPLTDKFERLMTLDDIERQALDAFPVRFLELASDQDIVREGDRPSRCVMLTKGVAATSKLTTKGRRQIMAFHIPGGMPDLHSVHLGILDSDIRTITACTMGFLDHAALRVLCRDNPRIAAVLWRTTLVDASIYREWLTNIGQREAFSRLAHVFCEMMLRMEHMGLAEGKECELPITQVQLGEATGMSSVHVNRTLQEMRGSDLISFGAGKLTIHDWDRLVAAAEFDPTYLHIDEKQWAA